MLEDQPRLDVVVVPMGGGGLISGIGVALSGIAPGCRLIGVEAEASEAFGTARRHGRITGIDPQPTIAHGLGGNLEPGAVTFDYVQRHVQEIVAVAEPSIVGAIGDLAASITRSRKAPRRSARRPLLRGASPASPARRSASC